MKKNALLLLLALTCVFRAHAYVALQPVNLTCEYIENPLCIDIANPRFAWTFNSKERNALQTAYEIIVSKTPADVERGKATEWSTGKIASSDNIQIEYAGAPLTSFTKYYWRVRVYDQNGTASAWSAVNIFETAMLSPADWTAKWISDGSSNPAHDEDRFKEDRMPLFRKTFKGSKKIIAAKLYISGLGYYEAYLNGRKVGNHVLDPGFTTYKKEVLYAVYDVTPMVQQGINVAAIALGAGWWNPLPIKFFGRWDLRDYQQTGRPCVKAEVHITYKDGSVDKIVTDESWLTAPGPVTHNNVYLGEKYDARLEQPGWNTLQADKSAWKHAVQVNGPDGTLKAQMQPAIQVTKTIKPVKIYEQGKDTFIVDMGQNFAGVVRIHVTGNEGDKITMRFGEDVYTNGSLNYMTSVMTQIKKGAIKAPPGAPETAWQEDGYILKGGATETWNPHFTFHGFRYVEVTGWPGTPTIENFEGLRMNSAVNVNGTFSCSNEQFNTLHEVIQWTFLSNIFSVQSDCPAREKMGYGADMVVSSNAFIYNYNMAQFYTKAVTDFANEQRPGGGITEIAPFTGIADRGYGDESGPMGWQLGFAFLQKQLYDFYGDKRIIAQHYNAFTRQMLFLQKQSFENLFYWDIGDHEALDTKPDAFSASCFYYNHAKLAAEFAGILGKTTDSIQYGGLAEDIKEAIVYKYNVRNTGRFDNATQSAQILALWYDLAPDKKAAFDVLMKEFERHHMHVSTGIFSTKMMFDVLRTYNRNDIAYTITDQRGYPGWLNMINNGATTLWETWAYPESSPSQNHPMFGSVDEWFYRSLLGINPASPGFKTIIIKPQPAGDLRWAKGSYQSIRGTITSEWKKTADAFTLNVTIPANTTALVYVPAKQNAAVKESGIQVNILRYEDGYAVIEAGSGTYTYTTQ